MYIKSTEVLKQSDIDGEYSYSRSELAWDEIVVVVVVW